MITGLCLTHGYFLTTDPDHARCPSCSSPGVDSNVEAVRAMLHRRAEVGLKKYNVTTDREDINLLGWLQHLQEELCDAAVYVERIKKEVQLASQRKEEGTDPSAA